MSQKKEFALEVKDVKDAGEFEGYASTFNGEPDSYGDIVAPGAFVDSLVDHKRKGTMPLMLWGHNSMDVPIGNYTDMAEDGKGLYVKGQIDLEDDFAARVHRAMKRKAVRGLSIGYDTREEKRDPKTGINTLIKVDLWEVSPVNFPANRRSVITAVKEDTRELREKLAGGDRLTVREWEKLFKRELGLSNSEAERAVRINLKGLGELDDTAKGVSAFLDALRSP